MDEINVKIVDLFGRIDGRSPHLETVGVRVVVRVDADGIVAIYLCPALYTQLIAVLPHHGDSFSSAGQPEQITAFMNGAASKRQPFANSNPDEDASCWAMIDRLCASCALSRGVQMMTSADQRISRRQQLASAGLLVGLPDGRRYGSRLSGSAAFQPANSAGLAEIIKLWRSVPVYRRSHRNSRHRRRRRGGCRGRGIPRRYFPPRDKREHW